MNIREFALITFSILAQLSVGSFLVLGVVHFFAMRQAGAEEADRLSDRALVAIWVTLLLGLAASLLHLGNREDGKDPERVLYLAVPTATYSTFFTLLLAQTAIQRYGVHLIVYDPESEVLVQWIKQRVTGS